MLTSSSQATLVCRGSPVPSSKVHAQVTSGGSAPASSDFDAWSRGAR